MTTQGKRQRKNLAPAQRTTGCLTCLPTKKEKRGEERKERKERKGKERKGYSRETETEPKAELETNYPENVRMSSRYAVTKRPRKGHRTSLMKCWKEAGALVRPNGIANDSKRPQRVRKAIFHSSPAIRMSCACPVSCSTSPFEGEGECPGGGGADTDF